MEMGSLCKTELKKLESRLLTSVMATVVSLFCGAGGLDEGFRQAGFCVIWANEVDASLHPTYTANHPDTQLDGRSLDQIDSQDIPSADGVIGGPPCQSWSAAGKNKGGDDHRGRLIFEFIRVVRDKRPQFFVMENVEGLTRRTHKTALERIQRCLEECGYCLSMRVLNAHDYDVPQDRKRLFIVGIRHDIPFLHTFPEPVDAPKKTLRDAIFDLRDMAVGVRSVSTSDPNSYLDADWSSQFMSRNRVRGWDEPSFTIPASARHVPIHPQAPKMIRMGKDTFGFDQNALDRYRRFTIREVARIQTFPDSYSFVFTNLVTGYKMIGNAVPCNLAQHIALSLHHFLASAV